LIFQIEHDNAFPFNGVAHLISAPASNFCDNLLIGRFFGAGGRVCLNIPVLPSCTKNVNWRSTHAQQIGCIGIRLLYNEGEGK